MEFLSTEIILGTYHLPFTYLDFGLRFLLPVLGIWIAGIVLSKLGRSTIARMKVEDETKTKLQRGYRIVVRLLLLFGFILVLLMFLGAAVVEIGSYFFTVLNTPFLSAGDLRISIVTLIAIIPMVYLANGFGNWTRKVLDKNVFDRMGVDPKARFSIGNLARYAAMTVFFLIGLSIVGISFSSLTALFAVFGVGIGFGLQTMVANFIAGLIIIMTRPIKQGDFIKAVTADGAYEGTVTEIKMIYTVINTLLNETIVVPNSAIVDNSVHNYSYDDPSVVYPIPIQVHYDSDLDQVKKVLHHIGVSCPFQKSEVDPMVQVYSFDESGITLRLLLTLSKASDRAASMNYTNEQIWRSFKAEGIEFPYPQIDVHLR